MVNGLEFNHLRDVDEKQMTWGFSAPIQFFLWLRFSFKQVVLGMPTLTNLVIKSYKRVQFYIKKLLYLKLENLLYNVDGARTHAKILTTLDLSCQIAARANLLFRTPWSGKEVLNLSPLFPPFTLLSFPSPFQVYSKCSFIHIIQSSQI